MNGRTGNRNSSDLQAKSALVPSSLPLHNSFPLCHIKALTLPWEAPSIQLNRAPHRCLPEPECKHISFSDQVSEANSATWSFLTLTGASTALIKDPSV